MPQGSVEWQIKLVKPAANICGRFLMASMVGGRLLRGKLWAPAEAGWPPCFSSCGKVEVLEPNGHLMDFRSGYMELQSNRNRHTLLFFPLNLKNLPTIGTKNEKEKKIVRCSVTRWWIITEIKLKLKPQTLHFCSVPEEINIYFVGHKNDCIPETANLTSSTPSGSRPTDTDLSKLECNIKAWRQYNLFQLWLCSLIYAAMHMHIYLLICA